MLDTDARRIAALRQAMTATSVREDFDYRLLSLSEPRSLEAHIDELRHAHILLMSRSFTDAEGIGERLSAANPALITGIHDERAFHVSPEILRGRPFIAAKLGERDDPAEYIAALVERWRRQTSVFTWDSRFLKISVPCRDILYFFSYNRCVTTVTLSGEGGKLNTTLDNVQAQVDRNVFIRIHKSYLVNRFEVARIDKSMRQAVLRNQEALPISDLYYADTGFLQHPSVLALSTSLRDSDGHCVQGREPR